MISSALGAGHSIKQILKYLSQHNPQMASQISSALNAGHTAEHVLNYISRHEKSIGKLISEKQEKRPSENLYKTAQTSLHPSLVGAAKFAGATAATIGGGLALSRAIPQILQTGIGQNIPTGPTSPNQPNPQTPQSPISPQGNLGAQQNQGQPISTQSIFPSQPPVAGNIPQQAQAVQPEVKPINVSEIINKHGLAKHIEELSQNVKDPKAIAAILYNKFPKEMKKFQEEAGKPMEEAIAEYMQTNVKPLDIEVTNEKAPIVNQEEVEASSVESESKELDVSQEAPKIEAGQTVASPQGVGEVKAIRNGKAIIEVNGKKHQVDEDELESEPEEVRDAKFDFDPSTIPEDLRSAPLNEVYLPHDRRHITVKYNAGLKPIRYIYFRKDEKPLSTDYINKIVQGVQLPISSGLNFWGAWDASKSDSRGSANYHELVSNSQEEGEPDDPTKEYWVIKEEAIYEHPYLEKAGKEELRRKEKEFNEAKKKPRKKKKS